ncbi:hypothetical protein DM02DRAFT_697063 [Periconia macrospinosa]|uniref:Uncharacterized protein n=1 Tax=Periconia macrospinosa TaxID=97972 RepID=A0A2V1D7X8_9PLEO|nr:hypothetical protein DM02DRAFT_697063 [Periconia macrospinosa]
MPTTYTIKLKNKSGMDHDYFLFVEAPIVKSGSKVYQNVYISSPSVADGSGTATFTCFAEYYAICGTSPNKALGSKVTVSTADSSAVQVCQGPTKLGTHEGSRASNTNDLLANQFIGLGAQDPNDPSNIVPIAVFDAIPGTQNYVQPHATFYISWGTFTAGQIIDVTTVATPVKIDFTGKNNPNATVVHNNDGTWTLTQ